MKSEMGKERSSGLSPLAALPRRRASQALSVSLRVMASKEARRRRILSSPATFAREAGEWLNLWYQNLAKPVAVPCAGGLASAMFLFFTIAPAFPKRHEIVNDVPVRLATPAALDAAFSVFTLAAPPTEDIVLDIDVDAEGRVVDYVVAQGQTWASNPLARKSLDSTLICARFIPATRFGHPQAGTVRITLRRNEFDLRG